MRAASWVGMSPEYSPNRSGAVSDRILVMSFKGESAKSTAAIELCLCLAVNGYRILTVDLDPLGSLTVFCGIQAELELDGPTTYDALRFEDPLTLSDVKVDLASARLILIAFETETVVVSLRLGEIRSTHQDLPSVKISAHLTRLSL